MLRNMFIFFYLGTGINKTVWLIDQWTSIRISMKLLKKCQVKLWDQMSNARRNWDPGLSMDG